MHWHVDQLGNFYLPVKTNPPPAENLTVTAANNETPVLIIQQESGHAITKLEKQFDEVSKVQ